MIEAALGVEPHAVDLLMEKSLLQCFFALTMRFTSIIVSLVSFKPLLSFIFFTPPIFFLVYILAVDLGITVGAGVLGTFGERPQLDFFAEGVRDNLALVVSLVLLFVLPVIIVLFAHERPVTIILGIVVTSVLITFEVASPIFVKFRRSG